MTLPHDYIFTFFQSVEQSLVGRELFFLLFLLFYCIFLNDYTRPKIQIQLFTERGIKIEVTKLFSRLYECLNCFSVFWFMQCHSFQFLLCLRNCVQLTHFQEQKKLYTFYSLYL